MRFGIPNLLDDVADRYGQPYAAARRKAMLACAPGEGLTLVDHTTLF
jgi:hypothetical protein